MERARAWIEAKSSDNSDTSRITAKDREKVEPEAEATERVKKKAIVAKRVAVEAGAVTRVKWRSRLR